MAGRKYRCAIRSADGSSPCSSVSQAFGRNIVNVILVDFRALDTFGEIVVVAVAAVAAYALLHGARSRARS